MARWQTKTDAEYFAELQAKATVDANGCWILPGFQWRSKGMKDADVGYGCFSYRGKGWRAHRIAWTLVNGEIPKGLFVLHRCDNPPCCNPDHLRLGTHKENMDDMNRKGRNGYTKKTFCAQGHPFNDENTLIVKTKKGTLQGRQCKACARVRLRVTRLGWSVDEAKQKAMIPTLPINRKPKRQLGASHV